MYSEIKTRQRFNERVCEGDPPTHRMDGEQLCEIGLRVAQEGAVPVGVVREPLPRRLPHGTGQQDADLGGADVVREVLIGCRRPCDHLSEGMKEMGKEKWKVFRHELRFSLRTLVFST